MQKRKEKRRYILYHHEKRRGNPVDGRPEKKGIVESPALREANTFHVQKTERGKPALRTPKGGDTKSS